MNIIDKIKTFNDACIECGTTEKAFNKRFYTIGLSRQTIAFEELQIIVKALNQGWEPDWNDSNQKKYYPYFDMRDGVSFGTVGYRWAHAHSTVGSLLCVDTSEKAEYLGGHFIEFYRALLIK